jgi:peptidoglycan/xylan/chitin deacetylase (PgdA/CDA1 family)
VSFPVPVLLYHHINSHAGDTVTVTPQVFAGQMSYLKAAGYRALSVAELLDHISGICPVQQKSMLLTFDDGWLDNYLFAYPVLMQYLFRATFFLVTDRVNAVKITVLPASVPRHEESKRLIKEGAADRVVMGWDLVRRLQSDGLMELYSHTATHRRCPDLTDAELAAELAVSKAVLEAELDRGCACLCWPYGQYDDRTVAAAGAAGYKALFTTINGFTETGSDLRQIRRIEVQNSVEWLEKSLSEGHS